MVTLEEAAKIAMTTANKNYHQADDILVLIPEETIHTSYGWVFF